MKKTLIAIAASGLVACTNVPTNEHDVSDKVHHTGLAKQDVALCCTTLEDLDYSTIEGNSEQVVRVTESDAVVDFKTGQSHVRAIRLPQANNEIQLTLASNISQSVFIPSILVLDSEFEPIEYFSSDFMYYQKRGLLNVARYYGELSIPKQYVGGVIPSYLVMLTTDKDRSKQTALDKPTDEAIRSGDLDANVVINSSKAVPHSSFGEVELAFYYSDSRTQAGKARRDESVAVVLDTVSNGLKPAQANSNQLLFMYTELVLLATEGGEYEKALKYVEDAESHGFSEVRKVFIQALKEKK